MPENVTKSPIYGDTVFYSTSTYGKEKYHAHEVTWPKSPVQIIIAKLDKRCPKCGSHPTDCRCKWCQIVEHPPRYLELGYENDKFFGAYCKQCEWTC